MSYDLEYEELEVLGAAIDHATHSIGTPPRWLNNQTSVFLTQQNRFQLVRAALANNEVIFRAPGLTLVAAPWEYALCTKLNRMRRSEIGETSERAYDITDAAAYLHQMVTRLQSPVPTDTIVQSMERYGLPWSQTILELVDKTYHQTYGSHGISPLWYVVTHIHIYMFA